MMTGASPQSDPTRPKRTRARTFVPLGVAAWLVLEIWLLTLVAEAAGGLTVFLLLIAGAVGGAAVVKRAGRRAWQNLARTMQPGAEPAEPAEQPGRTGNSFTMLGGLLLMIPGLVSDVAALLCLFPPTAALLRRRAESALSRRMGYTPGSLGGPFRQAGQGRWPGPGGGSRDGQVIQGEVVHDDVPRDDVRRDDAARGDAGRPEIVRDDKD
ncbi:FxsA family membrane protein [Streptomyces sp. NPDC007983]|uniref:FxsA family membrane protein n=1 Tax=Streptomyces sp. NPDC007983 TaxID=3364800 RepID=UPI0036E44AA5